MGKNMENIQTIMNMVSNFSKSSETYLKIYFK